MGKGADRGKSPNPTGTQPKIAETESPEKPGSKRMKAYSGRGAKGSKHAAHETTSETRNTGPRKTPARTTTRSADK